MRLVYLDLTQDGRKTVVTMDYPSGKLVKTPLKSITDHVAKYGKADIIGIMSNGAQVIGITEMGIIEFPTYAEADMYCRDFYLTNGYKVGPPKLHNDSYIVIYAITNYERNQRYESYKLSNNDSTTSQDEKNYVVGYRKRNGVYCYVLGKGYVDRPEQATRFTKDAAEAKAKAMSKNSSCGIYWSAFKL